MPCMLKDNGELKAKNKSGVADYGIMMFLNFWCSYLNVTCTFDIYM